MGWFSRTKTVVSSHVGGNIVLNNVVSDGDITITNSGIVSSKTIQASGERGQKSFHLPPWKRIKVDLAFDVRVKIHPSLPPSPLQPSTSRGSPFRRESPGEDVRTVTLHGDKAFLDVVEPRVSHDTLRFEWAEPATLVGATQLYFEVESSSIDSISVSGACNVQVAGICSPLKVTTKGASCLTLSGTADSATIRASGVSRLHAMGFKVGVVKATLDGTADVSIHAGKIDVDMEGMSSLDIPHSTQIEVRLSGLAELHRAGRA